MSQTRRVLKEWEVTGKGKLTSIAYRLIECVCADSGLFFLMERRSEDALGEATWVNTRSFHYRPPEGTRPDESIQFALSELIRQLTRDEPKGKA